MAISPQLPSPSRDVGDPGHTADHNTVIAALETIVDEVNDHAEAITAVQSQVDDLADTVQVLPSTSPVFWWREGDPDPDWAATARPDGLTGILLLSNPEALPEWKGVNDLVFVRQPATIPELRGVGEFVAETSGVTDTDAWFPDPLVDGDECWLIVGTNGTTPLTPSGWTELVPFVRTDPSNGLAVFTKIGAASDAGDAVNVVLDTSASAAAIIVAWQGAVTVDVSATGVTTTDNTAQAFPAVTPTDTTTVVGISALRFAPDTGGTSVGPRTGWTEAVDECSANPSNAARRCIVMSLCDGSGAAGVEVPAAAATANAAAKTANLTVALVSA